jgi:hypothetical protein
LLRNTTLTLACVVLILSTVYAQDAGKNEIGLLLGATLTPSIDVAGASGGKLEIGSGITLQLTYARRLVTVPHMALFFEVPALAIPLQDITASIGAVPRNYDSFFATPGFRVKVSPTAGVSPWLSAGGGYALFYSTRVPIGLTGRTTLREEQMAAQFNSAQVSISERPSSCGFRLG